MSFKEKIKLLSEIELLFEKQAYYINISNSKISFYRQLTPIIEFDGLPKMIIFDNHHIVGCNLLKNLIIDDEESIPYFKDIDMDDESYFILSSSNSLINLLKEIELDILLHVRNTVQDDIYRINIKQIKNSF